MVVPMVGSSDRSSLSGVVSIGSIHGVAASSATLKARSTVTRSRHAYR